MRLARFRPEAGADPSVGLVDDDSMVEIAETWLEALAKCSGLTPDRLTETGRRFRLVECEFLAPLPDLGRGVFCIGMNYVDHDAEARGLLRTEAAEHPVLFVKLASAMADANAALALDQSVSNEFDWEVELGVVIGRAGRAIDGDAVADHVAGYTIVNDVTARDLQRRHVQWLIGKNVDASSPIGPWVTTLDEAGYPPSLEMVLSVNGVEKQRGKADEMIFDVPTVVKAVSTAIELRVGDVFATGTPAGVGFARRPPEFLQVGDVIEASIELLGSQRNLVVAAERSGAVPDLAGAG